MKLVGIAWLRPNLVAHPIDGCLVEFTHIAGRLRIEPAPLKHGPSATLFKRCVVEISVWSSVEYFLRERRSLDHVTSKKILLVSFDGGQQTFEALDVHRFFEAVFHCLIDERMGWNLSFTGQ